MSNEKLIVISAPSGAGKTTLCNMLHERRGAIYNSTSYTTRPPRGEEQDGREYYFVAPERFKDLVAQGFFLEWAQVHDNYYGTPLLPLKRALAKGQEVILEIDVVGAEIVRQALPGVGMYIFIAPPSLEVLVERLGIRGTENQADTAVRIKNAQQEMDRQSQYDVVIVNDDLERAYTELAATINAASGPK